MRIAFVTHTYLPKIGGRETYVAKLAEYLSKSGDDVTVVTSGSREQIQTRGKLTVVRLPSRDILLSRTPIKLSYTIIPKLFRTLNSMSFDIIQAHDVEQFTTDVAALTAYLKKKVLTLAITGLGPLSQPVSFFAKLHNSVLGQATVSFAKAIIVGSNAKKRQLGLKNLHKVFVIPFHGTEPKSERVDPVDEARILAIGRIIPRKGFQVALRALRHVLHHFPNAKMTIVGPDEGFLGHLKKLATDLNVAHSIEFERGTRGNYGDHFRRALLVVVPSLYESEPPLTLLDAMAWEKPIIASSTDGISEVVVHEVNGLLVPPNDHLQLSNAIIRLLRDDSLRSRLSREALQTAQSFSWQNIANATRDVYRRVLS